MALILVPYNLRKKPFAEWKPNPFPNYPYAKIKNRARTFAARGQKRKGGDDPLNIAKKGIELVHISAKKRFILG